MESDAEDRRRNRRCRRAIFFRGNEEWNRTRKIVVATDAAGGPFFFAATKIRIGRSRPSQQQKLESAADIVAATAVAGGTIFFRGNGEQEVSEKSYEESPIEDMDRAGLRFF